MKALRLAWAIVMVVYAAPAYAGWNGAEWGMPMAAVKLALKSMPLKDCPLQPHWKTSAGETAYCANFDNGAHQFTALMLFRADHLWRVELLAPSWDEKLQQNTPLYNLTMDLSAKYGPPIGTFSTVELWKKNPSIAPFESWDFKSGTADTHLSLVHWVAEKTMSIQYTSTAELAEIKRRGRLERTKGL
jgi:hypothetical protein